MLNRKHIDLVIWDLDNSLTDTLQVWARTTGPAVDHTASLFHLDPARLREGVHAAPGQYRFCDFGGLLHWLQSKSYLPEPRGSEEQYQIEASMALLRENWYRAQKILTVFYPGAMDTLQAINKAGATQVIYTDTEASSLIRRLWLLAQNEVRDPASPIRQPEDLLNLFAHFYCMPSIEDDKTILRDVDYRFVLHLKHKMTIWTDGQRKAAPDHTALILRDFNGAPSTALFIGDTAKDGGSAVPLGIDFAWVRFGADTDEETVRTAKTLASPLYQYGLPSIVAMFNERNRPTVTLLRRLDELFSHYDFTNPTDTATTASRYNPAGPAAQTPQALRLSSRFPSPRPIPPFGPASHL